MKLYELTGQFNALWNMVSDEADLQMIEDTLQSIEGDIEEKVDNIAKLIKSIEVDETAIKTEEERLYNRRKALENRRENIKVYLEQQLMQAGIDKVKGTVFTVSVQNNPPSLRIADEMMLPNGYYVPQPPKVDRKRLLDDVKQGAVIEGVELQQTKSIRIR
jgi:hypothetical protein